MFSLIVDFYCLQRLGPVVHFLTNVTRVPSAPRSSCPVGREGNKESQKTRSGVNSAEVQTECHRFHPLLCHSFSKNKSLSSDIEKKNNLKIEEGKEINAFHTG